MRRDADADADADAEAVRSAARSIGRQIMVVSGIVVLGALGLTIAYVVNQSIPQERLETVAAAGDGQVFVEARYVLAGIVVLGLGGVVFAGIVTAIIARRAVRPLGEALRLQREFVADASHELRTPLAVLDTRLQALQRKIAVGAVAADAQVTSDLTRLRDDSRALVDIVDDLLLAAGGRDESEPVERGDGSAAEAPVVVADVAADVIASLQVLADGADVTLRLDADPGATVGVAATGVRRCVLALVDNAIAHSPRGGVVDVTIVVEAARGPRRTVVVRVADQGPGISGIDPARVFERFAHASPPARGDGAAPTRPSFGIGLALVRDVVTWHGGAVRVVETSPAGATIEFSLPASGDGWPAER